MKSRQTWDRHRLLNIAQHILNLQTKLCLPNYVNKFNLILIPIFFSNFQVNFFLELDSKKVVSSKVQEQINLRIVTEKVRIVLKMGLEITTKFLRYICVFVITVIVKTEFDLNSLFQILNENWELTAMTSNGIAFCSNVFIESIGNTNRIAIWTF